MSGVSPEKSWEWFFTVVGGGGGCVIVEPQLSATKVFV